MNYAEKNKKALELITRAINTKKNEVENIKSLFGDIETKTVDKLEKIFNIKN